jgi:transcriptional regulator GlxA family with amidase domain
MMSRRNAKAAETPSPLTVALLGFEGVYALDFIGPLDTLSEARINGQAVYQLQIVALIGQDFRSESGAVFRADETPLTGTTYDTIIVPGGAGLRDPATLHAAAEWCRAQALTARRVVSICTGAYALAAAGLLDGRRATTHWRFIGDLAARYPGIRPDPTPLFVKDGPIYTSAGVTAGMDLALALIEEDCGPSSAFTVAQELVMFLKRPGDQAQRSEPLAMQMRSADRFADLIAGIRSGLRGDLRVECLAAKVGMSARQFSRVFRQRFGTTPARHVEGLRIEAAQLRLQSGREPISTIAADVGFASEDAFARAFHRRLGVRPESYRRQQALIRAPKPGPPA